MSILTRLADFFRSPVSADRLPFAEARGLGATIPAYQANRPQWPTLSLDTFVDDGYQKSVVLFACVNYRAGAVASAPVRVYRLLPGGQREEVERHPLAALMREPNPEMSGAEFLAFTQILMDTTGFAAVEKVRSGSGRVVELWHLRSDWLKPIPRDQLPPRWEYRVPGLPPETIDSENVMVVTSGDSPKRGYTGLPPAAVALRELGIENAATDFLKLFFDQGAMPAYALRIAKGERQPDPAAADLIRERFAQAFGGWANWTRVALLSAGIDEIVRLGFDLNEMAYPELRNLTAAQICSAYRVTPILVGAKVGLEHMTYSNYAEARRHFYEDVATSLWARLDGAITRSLLPEFGPAAGLSVEFDTSDVAALADDEDARWRRATEALRASGITLNQYQAEVGLPGFGAAGDVLLLPFSLTPTKPEALVAPKPPPAVTATVVEDEDDEDDEDEPAALPSGEDDEEDERSDGLVLRAVGRRVSVSSDGNDALRVRDDVTGRTLAIVPPERRAAIGQANRTAVERLAAAAAPKVATFFREQGERIVEVALRSAVPSVLHRASDGNPSVVAFNDQPTYHESRELVYLDWPAEEAALLALLVSLYAAAGEAAYAQAAEALAVSLAWDTALPGPRAVLDGLAARPEGANGITATTRTDVERVVREALDEGASANQVGDRLRALFRDGYADRTTLIAREESRVAFGRATVSAYGASKVVPFVQVLDNPEHKDAYPGSADGLTCAGRHGLVVGLDRALLHVESDHVNGSATVVPLSVKPGVGG